MMSEPDPLDLLASSRRLRSPQDFADFERALASFSVRMDPADLPSLYRAFDDTTEDHEVYWGLVHLIERYDFRIGARVYVDVLPEMLLTAHGWMLLLAIRQLNHELARRLLIAAGRSGPAANRVALVTVLTELATERPSANDALAARAGIALAALTKA